MAGVVDAPEIEPSGGLVNTQIVVRLLTAKLGAALHYQVIPSTELASRNLTASDLFEPAKTSVSLRVEMSLPFRHIRASFSLLRSKKEWTIARSLSRTSTRSSVSLGLLKS